MPIYFLLFIRGTPFRRCEPTLLKPTLKGAPSYNALTARPTGVGRFKFLSSAAALPFVSIPDVNGAPKRRRSPVEEESRLARHHRRIVPYSQATGGEHGAGGFAPDANFRVPLRRAAAGLGVEAFPGPVATSQSSGADRKADSDFVCPSAHGNYIRGQAPSQPGRPISVKGSDEMNSNLRRE